MSYFDMMVELGNLRVRSVEIATVCTNARTASAVVFIVRDASFNNIYFILYIESKCVPLYVHTLIHLTYSLEMEWIFL